MYKKLCIGLVSVIIIILIIDICQVDGKGGRGGGSRGGSRGSRGRSRFGGSRNGVTARKGSSPYTRSNFRRALSTGFIYGSVRYMRTRRYKTAPDEVPSICTNNNDTDSNGTTYGYFICPRAGEPENFEYCCGDEKRERCCANSDSTGSLLGIVFGIIGGVVGIAVGIAFISVCFTCCENSKENLGNMFTTPNERPSNIDENSNKQTVDTEAGATNKTYLTTTSELGQTQEISRSTELDSSDCNNEADEKSLMNDVLDDRMTSIPCTIPYPENHSESITYPTHPEELSSPPVSPSMTTPYLPEQSTTYPPASTTTSITTPYPPEQSYSNTESEPTDITSHQPPLDSLSSDGNAYPLASITTPYPPEQSDLSAYPLSPSAPYSIDPTSVYTPSKETEPIETENTEPKREFSPPPYSEIEKYNPTST